MWKEVPRTRKKEVLSSHHVESSRPSLTTVSLEVPQLLWLTLKSRDGDTEKLTNRSFRAIFASFFFFF